MRQQGGPATISRRAYGPPNAARYTAIQHKKLLYRAIQRRRIVTPLLYSYTALYSNTARYSIQLYNTIQYTTLYTPPPLGVHKPSVGLRSASIARLTFDCGHSIEQIQQL